MKPHADLDAVARDISRNPGAWTLIDHAREDRQALAFAISTAAALIAAIAYLVFR